MSTTEAGRRKRDWMGTDDNSASFCIRKLMPDSSWEYLAILVHSSSKA